MCKYCEMKSDDTTWCEDIKEENGYGYACIFYNEDEKTYYLDASVSGLDNTIKINYCPKCGRKLHDEKGE